MAERRFVVFSSSLALAVVILSILHAVFPYFAFYCCCIVNVISSLILSIFLYQLYIRNFCDERIQPTNKAVLITGCDSGFGNLLAKRLDSEGFQVYACCLFPEGLGANYLKKTCSNDLQVLSLDVTNDESVANALTFVKKDLESNVLWAVVNNAGISKGSSTDFSTIEHFKDTIDVNTLGTVRVTKAFLPLLKKSKGRVVNVCSLQGRISVSDLCPYTVSKYAAIAFSQCLSLEMNAWGVRVITIEPEMFRTPIIDTKNVISRLETEFSEIDGDIISAYGEEYLERIKKFSKMMTKWTCSNIDIAVNDMVLAVTQKYPDHAYKPRRNCFVKSLLFVLENIPIAFQEFCFLAGQKFFHYPIPKDAKN